VHCLRQFRDAGGGERNLRLGQATLQFLVDRVRDERDQNLGFHPTSAAVIHWPNAKVVLRYPKRLLAAPKLTIVLDDLPSGELCIRPRTFQTVPLPGLRDLRVLDLDRRLALEPKKLVVAAIVQKLFREMAGSQPLLQSLDASVPMVRVLLRVFFGNGVELRKNSAPTVF
jgi:hypothetical protein